MKQITKNTILRCGDKIFQPIEVDGIIYWVDSTLPIEEVYPHTVIEKLTTGEYMLWQIDNINDIDRSCQYEIVAQSQPKLEGIPVISLENYTEDLTKTDLMYLIEVVQLSYNYKTVMGVRLESKLRRLFESNTNQYTQKDIEKVIELSRKDDPNNFGALLYYEEEILEQINSISLIEVDNQFNIIKYE